MNLLKRLLLGMYLVTNRVGEESLLTNDPLDEFVEFDATMGADVVKCPHCGANVPCSLFFDDEVECPKCGESFKKED